MTELAPQDKTGSYQRPKYSFARTIGSKQFPIEAGRYHVYVGNPCPVGDCLIPCVFKAYLYDLCSKCSFVYLFFHSKWCHRVRLATKLLKLDNIKGKNGKPLLELTTLVDDPIKASRGGWVFALPPSQLPEVKDLRGLYDALSPGFQGRCTAPILVDWKTRQIISNESSDIVRMLPLLLAAQKESANADVALDLYPSDLASKIDETNEWIYRLLNNGVYRCGFSTTQEAYQKASKDVLEGLERADTILQNQDFINGSKLTESDLLLLPTMLRFDGVYSPLFGAGGKHLRLQCDYPAIFAWLKKCWLLEGVRESIDIEDACSSYYRQLFPLNPGGILPTPVSAKSLRLED